MKDLNEEDSLFDEFDLEVSKSAKPLDNSKVKQTSKSDIQQKKANKKSVKKQAKKQSPETSKQPNLLKRKLSKHADVEEFTLGDSQEEETDKPLSLDDVVSGKKKFLGKYKQLWNMYWYMYQYNKNKGKHLARLNLDEQSLQIEYDRIFTKHHVKSIWCIESTGTYLPKHFLGDLKQTLDVKIPGSHTLITLHPISTYRVNFGSEDTKDTVAMWEDRLNQSQQKAQNLTAGQQVVEKTDKSKTRIGIQRMFYSFPKIKNYQQKGKRFNKYVVEINGICLDNKQMEEYELELQDICDANDVTLVKVKRTFLDFLQAFSITSLKNTKKKSKINNILLSDLDIAELDAFTQGKVGDDIGVYIGSDVETDNSTYVSFTSSTKAQNILISAITGGGKSFFIKVLLLFHALCKHRLAIMDYEGTEYSWLVKWLKGVSISMGLADSKFVNTLKIPDVSKLPQKLAEGVFQDCLNATKRIFTILVNAKAEEDDLQILFDDVMSQLFTENGIDKSRKSTYYKSKNLSFFDIYNVLERFASSETFIKKHGDLANTAVKRLEPYWSKYGQKRYLFEDEVDIESILQSRILHFNFGMQNQTDDSALPKEQLLKMSMMTYVFARYHGYNLEHGFYTVNLVEEFQRSGKSKELLSIVNHWITGGRKSNIINYLVTNSVSSLLDKDNEDAEAIRTNFTTYMIGLNRKKSRKEMVEAFDLEDFAETMTEVSRNPKYENCFLVIFNTGKIRDSFVSLMKIPPKWHNHPYFKTRRVENYNEDEL